MRRMILQGLVLTFLATLIPALSISAAAQEASSETRVKEVKPAPATKPVAVYRVDYTIREMEDGKVLNSRKYMLMAESNSWARSRVGSRVPIAAGEKSVTYQDVGMNIDCRVREGDEMILLDTNVETSSVVPKEESRAADLAPVFRRLSSNVTGAVALGKPTTIGSMDDVTSNHRFEIEATVTKVK